MKLSIVSTLYQSAPYIEEFCSRAATAARELAGEDYEIILVNDGSPDNSLEIAVHLTHSDPHLVVVDLSRNFGHHKAMMTGLSHAQGDYVFLIDSDLEEEPEWLLSFAKQMENEKPDVVYGVQDQRKGGVFERLSGRWFWILFNAISGLGLPANIVTARLMKRHYVDSLLLFDEREIFLAGLWHITGFDQRPQFVTKLNKGKSTYDLRRKIALFINAISSFSNAPLISIFYIGISIFFIAITYTSYTIFKWIFWSEVVSGWTSLITSIWVLGGLIISFIGIVGIYLSKIFSETKRRPYVIVKKTYKTN